MKCTYLPTYLPTFFPIYLPTYLASSSVWKSEMPAFKRIWYFLLMNHNTGIFKGCCFKSCYAKTLAITKSLTKAFTKAVVKRKRVWLMKKTNKIFCTKQSIKIAISNLWEPTVQGWKFGKIWLHNFFRCLNRTTRVESRLKKNKRAEKIKIFRWWLDDPGCTRWNSVPFSQDPVGVINPSQILSYDYM